MRKNKLLFALAIITFLFGCKDDTVSSFTPKEEDLLGSWVVESMEYDGSTTIKSKEFNIDTTIVEDTSIIMENDSNKVHFKKDSVLIVEYTDDFDLEVSRNRDKVKREIGTVSGKWYVNGNDLTLIIESDTVNFTSNMNGDNLYLYQNIAETEEDLGMTYAINIKSTISLTKK